MWPVLAFIGYLVLALAIPTIWMAASVLRKTAAERSVLCPRDGVSSRVKLNSCYAVRMHALGNPELLVAQCSRWPQYGGCGQECLAEVITRG